MNETLKTLWQEIYASRQSTKIKPDVVIVDYDSCVGTPVYDFASLYPTVMRDLNFSRCRQAQKRAERAQKLARIFRDRSPE